MLNLLRNYLTNRKQRVVLNGMESAWGTINAGVPQGSVLGPLLFLVYINDLEKDLKSSVKFFADDTSLFSIVHDPTITAEELNHDLHLIKMDFKLLTLFSGHFRGKVSFFKIIQISSMIYLSDAEFNEEFKNK